MNKKANITIISNNEKIMYNTDIEIKNKKINYKEIINNKITDVLYDKDKKILIRDNNEMYMEYDFNINKAIIYIKELKQELNLDFKTKNIIDNNNKIDIEYIINNEIYKYTIDME